MWQMSVTKLLLTFFGMTYSKAPRKTPLTLDFKIGARKVAEAGTEAGTEAKTEAGTETI